MKKELYTAMLIGGVFSFTGCANANQPAPQKIVKTEQVKREVVYQKQSLTKKQIQNERAAEIDSTLPKWVLNEGYVEDGLGAIGVAKLTGSRTTRHVRQIAMAYARKNLASRFLTTVTADFKDKLEDATTNDNVDLVEGIKESLEENIKKVRLSGANPRKHFLAKNGDYYIWLVISPSQLKKAKNRVAKKLERVQLQNQHNKAVKDEISKTIKYLYE